ncbi:hypothetical protein INR76_05790 [Marixanthomonas sp. SCSIO 43207]|uniref:hypothetical protein n=1 Tax=Marixanthomonas sp. SCSIO 43207 TaxID=2779360 RepID=UPI001CA8DE08|nr:hypothetical protein [Marixanthomonas sp. SCSIO 43207]UAB82270.1 hypothetical protein INR76_05790 [Marixanthomonas sp. SCSIO 43207]
MGRNPHFLVTGMQKYDVCGSEMIYLKGSAYEKPFPIQYFPNPEHNLDNCEGCKTTHQRILKEVGDYFKDFPNCCERHKNLQKHSLFKKEDFKDLAKFVADKVLYTHHHILNNLDQDNWEEEINNYIEYAITSFGQTPDKCGEPPALSWFMDYVIRMQKNHKLEGVNRKYKERQEVILQYIENYFKPKGKEKKDLNLLLSTYDKWYKFFPFELALFSNLKKHFSRTLPILAEKPKTNPYLGTAKVELLSQSKLLKYLSNITNHILLSIDTTTLLENEYISDKTKYFFDLKKKSHSVNQSALLSKPTKNEKEYIRTIKTWLKNEKAFINEIKDDIAILPENVKKLKQDFNSIIKEGKNRKYVLQVLEDLSITVDGKSVLTQRKKGALRGVVEALKQKRIIPNIGLATLCNVIADKINLELKSELDASNISEDYLNDALEYIENNPFH